MIKSQWLEQPIVRTNFHGPNDVRAIDCIWVSAWRNQQIACVPDEHADQPGLPLSLISLRYTLSGLLRPQTFFMRTAKILTIITKTRLYNFDPLKPHFYIVKLGFTGVYTIFLISAKNIDCGYMYSLEPPRRGGSNEYPQSMFWAEIWKMSENFIWKISVFGGEISDIFE